MYCTYFLLTYAHLSTMLQATWVIVELFSTGLQIEKRHKPRPANRQHLMMPGVLGMRITERIYEHEGVWTVGQDLQRWGGDPGGFKATVANPSNKVRGDFGHDLLFDANLFAASGAIEVCLLNTSRGWCSLSCRGLRGHRPPRGRRSLRLPRAEEPQAPLGNSSGLNAVPRALDKGSIYMYK